MSSCLLGTRCSLSLSLCQSLCLCLSVCLSLSSLSLFLFCVDDTKIGQERTTFSPLKQSVRKGFLNPAKLTWVTSFCPACATTSEQPYLTFWKNTLSQPLAFWCVIMGQSVMQAEWFAVFKVTVRAHVIRYDCFYHIYWTSDLFATKRSRMMCHHKQECFV